MLYWLKLRRIRIREQKKLDTSNLKLFKKIIEYIQNSNLQYMEKEEALHQIMDIILQAQAEYRAVDVIIGDYEVFCKSIIEEYTKDKGTVYTILLHFQRAIISMLFILVPAIIFLKVLYPKLSTGISAYLLIFAMGASFILKPFSHKSKQRKWASIIYFAVTMFAISYISESQYGAIIDNTIINNTKFILFGMILIIVVIEIFKTVRDKIRSGRNKYLLSKK